MTVKNIAKYHELNTDELNKLGTRELVNALESSRAKIVPKEGVEALTEDEVLWNTAQNELKLRLKVALEGREDVSTKEVPKKVEKKKMKY